MKFWDNVRNLGNRFSKITFKALRMVLSLLLTLVGALCLEAFHQDYEKKNKEVNILELVKIKRGNSEKEAIGKDFPK